MRSVYFHLANREDFHFCSILPDPDYIANCFWPTGDSSGLAISKSTHYDFAYRCFWLPECFYNDIVKSLPS